MALIKCPHCGKPISDRAVKCPHCGCDPKEEITIIQHDNDVESAYVETANVPNEEQDNNSLSNKKIAVIFICVTLGCIAFFCLLILFPPKNTHDHSGQAYADSSVVADTTVAENACDSTVAEDETDVAGSNGEANSEHTSTGNKNDYSYSFVVNGTSYRISFNKQEKTAQLYVEGDYAPNGKTFYGSCEFDGLYREGQIKVEGFSGAVDFNIHFKDEQLSWSSGAWIDYKNNYLYITQDAARAMNPDYRIVLTPVK